MATYRIGRDRNYGFVGKFKFSYTVRFIAAQSSNDFTSAEIVSGVDIEFKQGENFSAHVTIGTRFPSEQDQFGFGGGANWFGESADIFSLNPPYYSLINYGNKIPLLFSLKSGIPLKDTFILDITPALDKNTDPRITLKPFGWYREVSGTVEGYVYCGLPLSEYVDIDEHYPLKETLVPSNCDASNQVWVADDLTEKTVRQWPKYTTLNWYEAVDLYKKGRMGIFITHTKSSGEISTHSRFVDFSTNSFMTVSYTGSKTARAWQSRKLIDGPSIPSNGYIRIGGNLDFGDYKIEPLITPNGVVTEDTWDLRADENWAGKAKIDITQEPARKVTFDAQVFSWDQPYSDFLKAYIIGFGSTGHRTDKNFNCQNLKVVDPTYLTIETNSGKISGSQSYVTYTSNDIFITASNKSTGEALVYYSPKTNFSNQQKWIFGAIDRRTAPEEFDTLISPTKFMDFPEKWVRLDCGCQDINELSRYQTLDFDEDFFGCAPIPLRGWKFNAMTLNQSKDYILSANGSTAGFGYTNLLSFLGNKAEPYYYGSENLSGYRYLKFDAKSKNKDKQTFSLSINEISKGFTLLNNVQNVNQKTWNVSIGNTTSEYSTFVLDLCNPDNKIDFVDNQDSPYPRLNTYTTSKPKSTFPFAYLAKENKPKDDFLILKSLSGDGATDWMKDNVISKIKSSGIVYLSDDISKNVDYFEVNTTALPKSGFGTNIIFGKPRSFNGKIKLAKYFNADDAYIRDNEGAIIATDLNYFKQIDLSMVKNDITVDKTIEDLLLRDKDGKFPEEFEIYDYDPGFPDETDSIGKTNLDFIDGSQNIFVNPISFFDKNQYFPYDAVIIEDSKNRKVYKFSEYVKTNPDKSYISIETPVNFDKNIIFKSGSTIKLGFLDGKTDDRFSSIIIKFNKIEKISSNKYRAYIEYSKTDKNSLPNYDGIPQKINDKTTFFSLNAPIITVNPPRLVEFNFPTDTLLFANIKPTSKISDNEVNAIDDYPEDEVSNGPYYGVSRISQIESSNQLVEFNNLKLIRNNSLSNFIYSGNNNTFQYQTKFDASTTASTEYYTRRFWQQNTDARDEEEGDITWQHTVTENVDYWTLFPKSISEICDDINRKDEYVAPRWLNPNNPSSTITRHPGWNAKKIDKSYPVDPITGNRIYTNDLDPDYLNSDSGYATWLYGGGVLALPSGKNSGSGTSYVTAIDVSFNDIKTILAQTIFHRINADFPPGKPDLFGNTSLRNEDGTVQESTLHLRGGFIARGPGYGLILPPQKSTKDNLRKANLIEAKTLENKGSSESDSKGYFQTSLPFGKNKVDHYIELEKSTNFTNPSDFRSSTRNFSQAKRERAVYKGGKQNSATNLSICESGFENSILIAYSIPGTATSSSSQTAIITTDSFFNPIYEIYPVGYDVKSGTGVTIKGEFPFLLSSESSKNKDSKVHTFLFLEKNSDYKTSKSSNYNSLIAANTNMRNKNSWYPYIDGQTKSDANFTTASIAFSSTKYNSYTITDESPQLMSIGYADPGAILVRSIPLNTTNITAPLTDKTIFVDGLAPTDLKNFRLLDSFLQSGAAVSSFPTITQLNSREYLAAYSLNESPRKINFKFISNYNLLDKNTLLDLDQLTGGNLKEEHNIYGLTSVYDKKLGIHRSVFWSNGNIYYFENVLTSSSIGSTLVSKLHLVKGKLDDKLVTELQNRKDIIIYFDAKSDLNDSVPKQRPAIISCNKEEYDGKVLVAYDTGKCKIEAVLFHPFSQIVGTRQFDIECVNDSGSTTVPKIPVAALNADPTSGQSPLQVTFSSEGSYDPDGSALTFAFDFGDGTKSTDANPSHTFVNNTTDPIQFKVTLIVTNTSGISSDPVSIIITVNPAPVNNLLPQAKFSAYPTSGSVVLTVTFTDQSTPANDGSKISKYFWDTGDGNTFLKTDNNQFTFDYTRAGKYTPTLQVVDSLERQSNKFIGPQIIVDGVLNNPPSPAFQYAQTSFSPTLKIQFTDTSSDPEGPLVAWHWDFGDNQTADVQNPEHIYAAPGTYLVTLTVTDSGGLQVSGTRQVVVLPPGNNPPVANFNYSQQNRKLVIDFIDTSSDSDGTITTWNWDFGDNSFDTNQNPSHTYLSSGTYLVTLTVTDNGGKSNSITKNVIVNPLVNLPPIISSISGSQTSFKPSLVVKFTELSSDPDGYVSRWDWNFGDGQTFSTTDSTLKNPSHTYFLPGTYTVSLTVTDDGLPDGTNKKTATSSIRFTVSPPPANQPPVALFSVDANNILAPSTINFTDLSTDADGKIVSWLWEFELGSTLFFNSQTYQKTVSYTFNKSGTYPVKLTVTDDGNLTNTYILDIIIKNNPPVSIISAFPNPVLSQNQVTFNGSSSYDTDGSITRYSWDFGDGSTILQGRTQETHIYQNPGSYRASLTVIDNSGATNTANLIITVNNRNPVAIITYTTLTIKAPGSLTFIGDKSYDPDGSIVSYNWSTSNGLSATTSNATFTFTTEGSYTIYLTVTDDFGGTNTSSVVVTITPPDNILPIAILNVDKNIGVINDTFVFNTNGSYDPDGTLVLYQFDFGDGSNTQFVTPSSITHRYNSVGIFTAKLIVTDNRNGQSIETLQSVQKITINNQPPVSNFTFSPNNAYTFDVINFTDNSTDPENALAKWSWDFGDTTSFTTTDPLLKSPTKSYNKGKRNYTVSLTVYDNLGLSNTSSQVVSILNRKPFAVISTNATPNNNTITGIAPFTVIFDSNSYDLDGTVVNYEWYLQGLSGTPITTKNFTYTFTSARFTPYIVTLRVQDDDGDWSDVVSLGVKVNAPNVPPVAVIKANPLSNTSQAPITVNFSGAGSYDPDNVGGPLIYAWDFGNGSVSDLVNPSTVYSQPGTYKVTLTVTDNLGATNTATLDYIVKNNKPIAVLDTVPSGITQVQTNTQVNFTSQGSYDPDTNQYINGYKWLVDGIDQNSNTSTFNTSFTTSGNHVVTLSVFDNIGLESDPVSKNIFVISTPPPPPANKNPIAILGNEPGPTGFIELKVGDSFTFDGTTSYDPEDGANIMYEWSLNGVKIGFTSTFTNQFTAIGVYTVNLVVFDTQKLASTPTTNLGKRYTVDVNVSAAPNPLANKLYSSGQALSGAIASGNNTPDRFGFQLVDDTKQYTIIEAGLNHTFVVDAAGVLYASGSNSNGQLGFPSNITQLNSLTVVPLASKYKVVKVSAGDFCSAIIAEDITLNKRVLLVCGSNINGIFGQALPRTNIFNFQPILERATNNNGANYLANNSFLDVSCNSYILAFTDNRQIWVAGKHNYINKTGVNDTGFFPINIDPNPDLLLGSTNYLNPFRLEVGFNNFSGFVTGLSYDIDNQIVWFAGLSTLRGWGYAYDISTYENSVVVITASQDPYFDHAIYVYFFSSSEIPQFNFSSGLASDLNPGENFLKVSTGKFGFLALSENLFYPYGMNDYGQLGYAQSVSSSIALNLQYSLPSGVVLANMSVIGISDIAAGGNHSIILASNVKPSSNSFTIIKPGGYATDPQYPTNYPITQIAG